MKVQASKNRDHKKSASLLLGVLFAGLLFAGCNDHLTIDRDPSVTVRKGMTWAWRPEGQTQAGNRKVISRDVIGRDRQNYPPPTQDAGSQEIRDRLKIGFQQAMAAKGLKLVDDPYAADFLVDYHVGIQARKAQVASPAYPPVLVCGYYGCWNSWGPGYWGPPEVIRTVKYHEGTLVFEMYRNRDNRLAYRARSDKVVNHDTFRPDQVNEATKHMLKDLKPTK